MRSAMSFYFMLDFLRSLHYQVPASFYADDLFIPLSTGVSFRQAYRGLVLGTNNLPTGLISHDLLLLLLGILSDIVALQNTLGPALTRFGHHPGLQHLTCVDMELFGHDVPRETPRVSSPCEALLGDANEEYDPAAQYVNHFLPSTALDEYRRMSHSLMGGLVRWSHLFALHEESSQHVENSDNSLMTLFHLGRLLLSAGPDLFTFSALAGYGGAGSFGAPAPMDSRATPRITGATLKISWAILESIESQRDKSETPSLTPLWNPVATFYAALVAWASMHGQQSLTKRTELSQARRLLRLLRLELDDMVWPCSAVMSSILRDLEVRTETLGQA